MIPSEAKPKVRDDVTVQELGDEILRYDAEKENVHILNGTAQKIWQLCDGSRSMAEIVKELINAYPDQEIGIITNDIKELLEELAAKNLILIL